MGPVKNMNTHTEQTVVENRLPLREHFRFIGVTLVVCFTIALFLSVLSGFPDNFTGHLVISLAIGTCIHVPTALAFHFSRGRWNLLTIYLLSVPTGLILGLVIGSTILGERFNVDLAEAFGSLMITVVATSFVISYSSILDMREALRQEEVNRLNNEKRLAETQLKLLQSQIEPHFLFNTLSNVISLVATDPSKAELMLRKLTQFLRASLRRSRSESGSLQDEIELAEDYLGILKIRMGERLQFCFDVDADTSSVEFPPLILQPLVENAIVHGLEPLEEGGSVNISITSSDFLDIKVVDTGVGLAPQSSGSGLGLSNVRQRLEMLFGDSMSFTLKPTEPHGLTVLIKIPKVQLT